MAWVDLQVNGYAGVDFNSAGLTVAAVKTVVDRLAADGTGMFLPTFVTGDSEVVCANLRVVAAAREASATCARAEERASVMFIPDGHHLPDTMLKVYTRAVPVERLIAVSDAQYPAGMPPGEYEVCGAHARLEPDGLLWNPARNCLVGATAPMAKMMALLRERIGLSEAVCREIGYGNPLRLIGLASSAAGRRRRSPLATSPTTRG